MKITPTLFETTTPSTFSLYSHYAHATYQQA